jgi:DNA-binding XRE family transcriptional regulator
MPAMGTATPKFRTKRARSLIDRLFTELPTASPARNTAFELYQLFNTRPPPKDITAILLRVPGSTDTERAQRIGISKQCFSDMRYRKHRPGQKIAQRIAELAGVPIEEVR